MENKMSKSTRQFVVILNYAFIILFLVCFYLGQKQDWSNIITVAVIVSILAVLVTFIMLHIKTGLWKLVHSGVNKLDERQIQITHESLRHSYGIFSVICLAVLLVYALLSGEWDSMMILIFASLLYLAHTLPSSIIAWTEKKVD